MDSTQNPSYSTHPSADQRTHVIHIEKWGKPDVLVGRDIRLPAPAPGEVHLKVKAAGVNFADLIMRMGLYGTVPPRPFSPGFEVAGEIVRTGGQVEGWKAGDRAIALMRHGGYAGDVIVPADQLFPWPEGMTAIEAAAIPVTFLTAWICLFRAASVRKGEKVLVLGAGGGVGTAAVQLAVKAGLEVIGTAGSEAKRRFVRERLGAKACFDSRGDWETGVRGVVGKRGLDVALDPVGGRSTRACRNLLSPLGRLVFYGMSRAVPGSRPNKLRAALAWWQTPRFHPMDLIRPNLGLHGVHLLHLGGKEEILREAYMEMLPSFETAELAPVLDKSFPLTRAGAVDAHRYLHARRNLGKVVLEA
ncbi:MAG: zinc-binding dehydrogenase [Candidatus Eisenbacteria bacterium]|uniref:Zinc-binding dehydrogenase n=1 Tax=Eiseniibacteriota bacterium TaxID=2212470 RepID=A0A948W6V4_UNCEI|nr:zinc-binding dehydrogenase [Candidatus Eisenbacteria bacterium]MBU1948569.1 zinc-binding dehydrogenase [Candidatus Eisenbacteria bacterium]MBU2691525.1 zinc-binding dehydrogenase [Candidatus Eisenbacteria bacterium]